MLLPHTRDQHDRFDVFSNLLRFSFSGGEMRSLISKFAWVVAISAIAAPLSAAGLRAGVARADITPPTGLSMYGYMDRTQPATGTMDPLEARVLVLQAGNNKLALITLDLGRDFGPASMAKLEEAVRRSTGISHFFITASHTHSGPNILDEYPPGRTPAWETAALDKIASAVEEANARLEEVRLGVGRGRVYIGYNRRVVHPDGTATMLWTNPDRLPTAPLDPTVTVLRLDRADGSPLAVLVNYACHPVVFGADNLEYSADFVGVMRKTVEEGFGGKPLCLFLQGGDGDINPYDATTPINQGAAKKRDWTGETLGREALRVAQHIRTGPSPEPTLQSTEDTLQVPLRWDAEKFRGALLSTYGPRVFEDHAELVNQVPVPRALPMILTTVLLNRRIALVGLPGEPFVDFQINFRDRCPVPYAFFAGYTNGYYDYFPTIQTTAEGGYGAADSNTYVAPGTGERMVNLALVRLYEMLGRLRDVPEDLK
jgi:neutral/alkaline ceramidase-like enzyme